MDMDRKGKRIMRKGASIGIIAVLTVNALLGTSSYFITNEVSAAGGSSSNIVTVAAIDTMVPSVSPANASVNVPVNTNLTLQFGQRVRTMGSQTYTISRNTGSYVEKMDVSVTQNTYSNRLELIPPSQLVNGTLYNITFPAEAFIGEDGTRSSQIQWSFTTASVSAGALMFTSQSPSNGSTNIAVNTNPTLTFNRNIRLNSSIYNGGVTLRKSSTNASIPISVSTSGSTLTISPSSNLEAGNSYYIEIAGNGIYDTENPSSYFAGIGNSGSNRWSFQTVAPDRVAPLLQSATMYSNTAIRLAYNEPLNSAHSLLTSSFNVTVNGEMRRLSSAYVSGENVYVYLETGVAVGQNVQISYTANGNSQSIQDLNGNAAASFASKDVTNGIDSVMPKPRDGYATSNMVSLTFSESIKSPSSYAYGQFTVTANGSSKRISSMTHSGQTIYLYLSDTIPNGDVVKVSYSPGLYPLQDYRGLNLGGFNDFYVRNTNDSKAPEFQKVEGSGNKVILTYNEALRSSSLPMKSQFSILVNNKPVYVTQVEVISNQVILTLVSSFTKDQSVTLSYVAGSGGIADLNGNLAGYINLEPVTYGQVVEGVRSATVNGDTITLVFNSTLRPVSFLPVNQFYVNVDKVNRLINSATISGDTVTIKLTSPVQAGQVVELSYLTGAAPLYDSLGNLIKSFNNVVVQNLTGSGTGGNANTNTTVQPDYMSALSPADFGITGYLLNLNAAQAVESRSKYGQTMKKYVIDQSKLQGAFQYLAANNISNRRIVFEVPANEKAAEVVFPIQALMEMYSSGKTASIAVKYKDVLYDLPIEKVVYSEISRALGINVLTSANLVIQLEAVTKAQLPTLNYSNGVTTTPMVDPVQLTVSAYNGNASQNTVDVGQTGRIYMKVTSPGANVGNASMVKYNVIQRTASFLPSKVSKGNVNLIFSGKITGNSIVGPAMGYSYFTDTAKHWAQSDIAELASKLIVDPKTGAKFEPQQNITRAEFATFIAKGLGLEGDEANARKFPDVKSGDAAKYIGAAAKAGIITGNTDGTFKPGSYITREQMALMMVRAMEYAGYNFQFSGSTAENLNKFKDASKIQSKETVAKAVSEGIIQGMTVNKFSPQGNATRAQAAVMLKRILSKLQYL